jgi:hypothetical protein
LEAALSSSKAWDLKASIYRFVYQILYLKRMGVIPKQLDEDSDMPVAPNEVKAVVAGWFDLNNE